MKCSYVVTMFAMSCALTAGPALAQNSLAQPGSVRPVGLYDYAGSYYAQDTESASPSDMPVPPAAPTQNGAVQKGEVMSAGCGCATGCDSGCNTCCNPCGGCCEAEPWSLFGPHLACHAPAWNVGGWISSGYYNNGYGAPTNGILGFRNLADELTLDQGWIYAEREMDASYGLDFGFRVDYLFGVDGPDTQAFGDQGWDFGWNSTSRGDASYGSAIPQLYGEVGYGDLSVKIGHFFTIIGYEVVQDTGNFFYSHAYTMYYGEPFTHTGALASYQLNDAISLSAGWTMGWDSGWDNLNDASTFLGGITTQLTDSTSVAWGVTFGDQGVMQGTDLGDVYMNSIVISTAVTDRLNYVFHHDLGMVDNSAVGDYEWYSFNQYLMYDLTSTLAVGARYEWFYDGSGERINADGNSGIGGMTNRGSQGDYQDITLGANWRPNPNVIVRPEVRWDWFTPDQAVFTNPFNNGQDNSQFTYGVSSILTY